MSIDSNVRGAHWLRRFRTRTILQLAVFGPLALSAAACDDGDDEPEGTTGDASVMTDAPAPAVEFRSHVPEAIETAGPVSLLELDERSDFRAVEARLRQIGARVLQSWNDRLIAVELPPGARAVLEQAGVQAQYEGAVDPVTIGIPERPAQRFVEVYNSLYHPGLLPAAAALVHTDEVVDPTAPFELSEAEVEQLGAQLRGPAGYANVDRERDTLVPYASGTVVVAIFLPESNGSAEPSTEDWSEEAIVAAYDKVQRGLDLIARADANSDLRIIVHYESVPGPGQLEGTIECDYEAGKHFNFTNAPTKNLVMANLMSKVLGREIGEFEVWPAYTEYLNNLRDRYNADGAFINFVPRNGNGTAGIRAHAFFNGPYTAINDTTSWRVYAHEYGHIFGASDEYCPDACRSPVQIVGYQSMFNGNAIGRAHAEGVDRGHGEGRDSLMRQNIPDAINGFVRGAWGWLDEDGDGLLDVRATAPKSELVARVEGRTLHLSGMIEDQPESGWISDYGSAPFSSNRIAALRYRVGGEGQPWLELALDGRTRGRQLIDRAITDLPVGDVIVDVAAVNDVGGVQITPQRFHLEVEDAEIPAMPSLSLRASKQVVAVGESVRVTADALDPEGGSFTIEFDTNADGSFDHIGPEVDVDFDQPGTYELLARVTTAGGMQLTTSLDIPVLAEARGPDFRVRGSGSVVSGAVESTVSYVAESADDSLEYNWIVDRLAPGARLHYETGFVAGQQNFSHVLRATPGIASEKVSLFGDGYRQDDTRNQSLKIGEGLFAHAAGARGLIITRYPDGAESELVAELELGGDAHDLMLHGTTLFVSVGELLQAVDISDVANPRRIEQDQGGQETINLEDNSFLPIPEERHIAHKLLPAPPMDLDAIQVRFVLDHPDPSQLVVELVPPRESNLEPLVLLDHEPGLNPRDQYYFTSYTDSRLAEYIGARAGGSWQLRVSDTSPDGVTGTLEYSQIILLGTPSGDGLHIGHRKLRTVVGGHTLLLGSFDGAWAVDVRDPSAMVNLGAFQSDLLAEIVAVDDNLALLSYSRFGDGLPKPYAMVVDCQPGQLPAVHRGEVPSGVIPFFRKIGDYYYTGGLQDDSLPNGEVVVLDLAGFAAGGDLALSRQPGAYPGRDGVLVGDRFWMMDYSQGPQEWDMSEPFAPRLVGTHEGPRHGVDQFIDSVGGHRILAVANSEAAVLDVSAQQYKLSDMYEITVQARNAAGLVREAHRYVQHNPYNHAPVAASVEHLAGGSTYDTWRFQVNTQDADHGQVWDPTVFVRADIDGDGVYDTRWYIGSERYGVELPIDFEQPGSYELGLQVRDGYWGTHEFSYPVEVGSGNECTAEGGECGTRGFCWFEEAAACGAEGEGTCVDWGSECTLPDEGEVCGCDGRTYANQCEAQANTASIVSQGACPDVPCGGVEDLECAEGFYCERPDTDVCGEAQSEGVCRASDRVCLWLPDAEVCGCDGRTHWSECHANQAGTAVAHEGICADDCRVAGCDEGAACMQCFGGFVCLPEGSIC